MRQFICFMALILAACQPADAVPSSPVPVPSATSTSAPAPTFTPSPTPTVAHLMAPYTIDGLRHHQFQSGKITITSTVETTDTFISLSHQLSKRWLDHHGRDANPGQWTPAISGHHHEPRILRPRGLCPRRRYLPRAEYLNKYGYITLASDYRSWGKSDIGASFFYTGLAIDVINLMNAVSSIPQADPVASASGDTAWAAGSQPK